MTLPDSPLGPLLPETSALWHPSAPPEIRETHRSDDGSASWDAWIRHLAARTRPVPLAELLGGKTPPLGWALPEDVESGVLAMLLSPPQSAASRNRGADATLLVWLGVHLQRREFNRQGALEALAWVHSLPAIATHAPAKSWWLVLDYLARVAASAGTLAPPDDPLARQLLAGELPLALAYLFPEIAACRELQGPAREALSAGLTGLLDEGLPIAAHHALFRPLLACWTRCRAMGGGLPGGPWNENAADQYRALVRQALRLARPDGAQVLSCGRSGAWCPDLFDAALRFGGDDDRDIASIALPKLPQASGRKAVELGLPEAAARSERAAVAVLRTAWARASQQLTVIRPDGEVRIEIRSGRDVLASGPWRLEVLRDGRPLPAPSRWEETCWLSDESADYLELEGRIDDGLRVQRHMLLAREDGFLLLADALLSDHPARFEHRGLLPLGPEVGFAPAEETREGFLMAGKGRGALVLPLALPEWRTDPRGGTLQRTGHGLELRQAAEGTAMFAPLWIDLNPKRSARRYTWRQLTVAESLRAAPSDRAVGYRVQIGNDQWLVYRSLARRANRTLLGHNLVSELLVARFEEGEVDPVLEIEGSEGE